MIIQVFSNLLVIDGARLPKLPTSADPSVPLAPRYPFYTSPPSQKKGSTKATVGMQHSETDEDGDPTQDTRFCTIEMESYRIDPPESPLESSLDPPLTSSTTPLARFEATHEGTTQISCGILHLYREPTPDPPRDRTSYPPDAQIHTASTHLLGVLAVPMYMSPSDFLSWIGDAFLNQLSHLRMIRDHLPYRYMVLLRFREAQHARLFFSDRNGRAFNAFEPQLCMVVKISAIAFQAQSVPPFAFPHDVLILNPKSSMSVTSPSEGDGGRSALPLSPSSGTNIHCPETLNLHELPTCPVCLERMDASTAGVVTIICQHTFHCGCLRRWVDCTCPVCRYTQQTSSNQRKVYPAGALTQARDELMITSSLNLQASSRSSDFNSNELSNLDIQSDDFVLDDEEQELYPVNAVDDEEMIPSAECGVCQASSDLWACLICGHIGCGRYAGGHARDHYERTCHLYALEVCSQRTWDYTRESYVHRLVQNESDGKIVEVAPPVSLPAILDSSAPPPPGFVLLPENDVHRINKEYMWLLQSQLDAQRQVLEAQLRKTEARERHCHELMQEEEKKRHTLEKLTKQLQSHLSEERAMSHAMVESAQILKGKITSLENQIEMQRLEMIDLHDQIRDLSFFIESRDRIESSSKELQKEIAQGTMVVQAPPPTRLKGKKKSSKR
jgi:predicted Holliday junction resolvase-like endonuclease